MNLSFSMVTFQPLLALVLGILILIVPRVLNYAVAAYLIVVGIMGLTSHM
ncbi:DUF3096 domain-containing protein [Stella sp.]|jgi:general stress protein CsbA